MLSLWKLFQQNCSFLYKIESCTARAAGGSVMPESGDDDDGDAAGDDEARSKTWSIPSDRESHGLKVPYLSHRFHYFTCAVAFRVFLWTLLVSFQALPLCWIVLMAQLFSQSPSYITWLLNSSIGVCGGVEVIFSCILTPLGVIQLLQRGSYKFIHKCRVIFNVVVAAFLSHLLLFLVLALVARFKFFGRMEKEMRRELRAYRNLALLVHPLDERWERTQEKYACCGFGGEADYVNFPPSCCPQAEVKCNKGNRWKRNCFTAEGQAGLYFMNFGTVLIGLAIPFAILFYYGFRYFRPYWDMDRPYAQPCQENVECLKSSLISRPSLETLADEESEEDEEEEEVTVTTGTTQGKQNA